MCQSTGWCLSSVLRQSGGYCRYEAETGRRHPCHGAVADSFGPLAIVIPQLQYIDGVFDVLVTQVQQICAKSWETVEIPQLQLVSPGQLLLARCVQRQVPILITLQFIDSCERPCDHTATVVQWQSLRFSSSSESWTDQLCNKAWYSTFSIGGLCGDEWDCDAFCVIFRAPPVVPELSASFWSPRR